MYVKNDCIGYAEGQKLPGDGALASGKPALWLEGWSVLSPQTITLSGHTELKCPGWEDMN